MEVDAAGRLEDAAQLHQPGSHHHQISHHRVAPDELAEGGNHILHRGRNGRVADYVMLKSELRLMRPLPGVGEGANLRRRFLARLFPEQYIIRSVGVERRI